MRKYTWICAVLWAFVLGIAVDRVVQRQTLSLARKSALAGIEKLHRLDERVTLLQDPKTLQDVWTDDAVRIYAWSGPVDVGKQAIHASDMRSHADAPGFTVTSYKTDVREVHVIDADWAFE